MKCVIITYQSGKTAVYIKTDPALLDEILHSNEWIVELQESEFVQPQLIETNPQNNKLFKLALDVCTAIGFDDHFESYEDATKKTYKVFRDFNDSLKEAK